MLITKINRVKLIYPLFIKVNPPISKFAKQYKIPNIMSIDITYKCNFNCFNCNRQCRQAPSNVDMSVEQINKFVDESIKNRKCWDRINVCGGEPTLNNNFLEILNSLLAYKKNFSIETKIVLITNGAGKVVNTVLSKVPAGIRIDNSFKIKQTNNFYPINLAPKDSIFYKYAAFSLGCPLITRCGLGFTPFGYYPCVLAGSIDRVFGFNLGAKELILSNEAFVDVRRTFCQYCGAFRFARRTKKEKISASWGKALRDYREKAPILDLY